MGNEVWDNFQRSFYHRRHDKIVIYGIGENTREIVEKADEYNITGLLDGIKKDGIIYGIPILDESHITKEDADIIIIIARSSNLGIILSRIARKCLQEKIKVFDIQGNDLLEAKTSQKRKWHDEPNKGELLKKIEAADVISFDIFDTLIMRKIMFPTDVFELLAATDSTMPSDFAEKRVYCERLLIQEKKNPTIHMIYNQLKDIYGWDNTAVDSFLSKEYKTDCNTMVRREEMYDIYKMCCRLNKKIYFISDMYYTKDMLMELLEGFNINEYEDILVSCEYQTSKMERLFDIYNEIESSPAKLHIGDDVDADITSAKLRGIDTYHIMSARDMLKHSWYLEVQVYAETLLEKVVIGCFIAKIFNNPFSYKEGKGIINDSKMYGYTFIGPLVFKFCLWLIERAQENQTPSILFAARDGYIIEKVYEYMRKNSKGYEQLPKGYYMYASRLAFVIMSIFKEEDIQFACELAYDGSPEEMLKERFRLEEQDIAGYDSRQYKNKLEYILSHTEKILRKAQGYRENFFKYIQKENLEISEGTAYFDYVSSGTCHRSLQRTLDIPLKGYYFSYVYSKYTYSILDIEELFYNQFGCISKQFICNHYLFLENIFSSPEPTLKEFGEYGEPIFLEECREKEQIQEVEAIQEGIMAFVRDVLKLMNGYAEGKELSKELVDTILSFIISTKTSFENKMNINNTLVDEFCQRKLSTSAILGEISI